DQSGQPAQERVQISHVIQPIVTDARPICRASSFLGSAPAIVRIMTEVKPTGAFFGRRKGHPLRQRQATLMDSLLPRLRLDLSAPAPNDLRSLFNDVDAVRLESGFG